MRDISVTVIAERHSDSEQIAQQLREFVGLKTLIKTETFKTASRLDDQTTPIPGTNMQTTCLIVGVQGQEPDIIPVRYNLTRKGWQTIMKATKFLRGARVAVTGPSANVAAEVAESLRRLDIEGLRLDSVSISNLGGCNFDFILAADTYFEPTDTPGRIIRLGPLLLSPVVIADLLYRQGLDNEAAKATLAQYLRKVKLVNDDYLGLLDLTRNKTQHTVPSKNGGSGRKYKLGQGMKYTLVDLVGKTPALKRAKELVEQLKNSTSSVVLQGETGTGKEMFAQAIHAISPRGSKRFTTINCASIPETLAESELFGYEDGAFTGARKGGKEGLFENADGGTIFLDEINDMSLDIQARLLRVLEDGTLTRVGGHKLITVDVRIIAACSKPLDDYVKQGYFRKDLFYRLCVIPINLPSLRERIEDIPLLVQHFLTLMGETRSITPAVWELFMTYHWPGNIRELKHCLEYMRTVTDNPRELDVLPPHIGQNKTQTGPMHSATPESVRLTKRPSIQTAENRSNGEYEPDRGSGQVVKPGELNLEEEDMFIMEIIEHFNLHGHGIGRRFLTREACQYGIPMSEAEIRTRLSFLRTMGYVEWGAGRSGVKLSGSGQQLVQDQPGRFRFDSPHYN